MKIGVSRHGLPSFLPSIAVGAEERQGIEEQLIEDASDTSSSEQYWSFA